MKEVKIPPLPELILNPKSWKISQTLYMVKIERSSEEQQED